MGRPRIADVNFYDLKTNMKRASDAKGLINPADKEKWNGLLAERSLVPPPVAGSYTTPDFPTASVPDEALFADALEWVQSRSLIDGDVSYSDSVDGSFLP